MPRISLIRLLISPPAAATSGSSAAPTAIGAWPSLVDGNIPAFHVFSVQLLYRGFSFSFYRHLYETESFRSAAVLILDYLRGFYLSKRLKGLP